MNHSDQDLIHKVRTALGRSGPLTAPPTPPLLDEPLTRLVHTEIGLPALFAQRAIENKMDVESLRVDDLPDRVIAYLQSKGLSSVATPVSPFLEKVGVADALHRHAFKVGRWDQLTMDQLFDYDAGLTDVHYAVAETGSLVVRSTPTHGRALSLIPPLHIAVVEPRNILPDLVDLFDKLARDGAGTGTAIITGPSKTADIEMNLVQGVHGPGTVKVFVLE